VERFGILRSMKEHVRMTTEVSMMLWCSWPCCTIWTCQASWIGRELARDDHAKGRIWHGLFTVVLHRPFRASKAHVLFAGVCLYLCFVVEVAVVASDELRTCALMLEKLFVIFGSFGYEQGYNNKFLDCPRGCTPVAGQSDYRPTMDTGRSS